jgi:hypothetical protein
LIKLRVAGLIEISSAQWNAVHYNIHPVAWKYMVRFPTKFINRVLWPSEPWVLSEKMGMSSPRLLRQTSVTRGERLAGGNLGDLARPFSRNHWAVPALTSDCGGRHGPSRARHTPTQSRFSQPAGRTRDLAELSRRDAPHFAAAFGCRKPP